jgi:hypothetical protein
MSKHDAHTDFVIAEIHKGSTYAAIAGALVEKGTRTTAGEVYRWVQRRAKLLSGRAYLVQPLQYGLLHGAAASPPKSRRGPRRKGENATRSSAAASGPASVDALGTQPDARSSASELVAQALPSTSPAPVPRAECDPAEALFLEELGDQVGRREIRKWAKD